MSCTSTPEEESKKRVCDEEANLVASKRVCCENEEELDDNGQMEDETVEEVVDSSVQKPKYKPRAADVGITEYINKKPIATGVIKQRYSDFHVNELSVNGDIVRLTSFDLPAENTEDAQGTFELKPELEEQLKSLSESSVGSTITIQVTHMTKDERTTIHKGIRQRFPLLISNTAIKGEEREINVSNVGSNLKKSDRSLWPSKGKAFTQFVMFKENLDTMEAINLIAKIIRIKPGLFAYAGVKDKRAKTSQLVSIHKTDAKKLLALNEKMKFIKLGNFTYVCNPLKLGDLCGNRFRIVIRNVSNVAAIEESLNSLKKNGFINYYGMQRFGTTAIPTHRIGKALLKGEWKKAIQLILEPRVGDDEKTAEARKYWMETEDAAGTLKRFMRKNSVECHLLRGLNNHKTNDFVGALNQIPRNMRLMYVHSYQSYLWNKIVSRRIQQFGLSVLDGDLVDTKTADVHSKACEGVHSKSDNCTHDTSVTNVVMPLPGYDVRYPQNEMENWYKEAIAADGLDNSSFQPRVKDYALSGGYRTMVVHPKNMTWSIQKYDDSTIPLLQSDLEKLNDGCASQEPSKGLLTALCVEFSLPPSSYATMALREIINDEMAYNPV